MSEDRSEIIIAVAFAHTAKVRAWRATVAGEEREVLERTLRNLCDLGHVASFRVDAASGVTQDALAHLRTWIDDPTVDACAASPASSNYLPPAFLMPVWSFDHLVAGAPAATASLRGLELKLVATPSPDEELGAFLPGRSGRWLIHAGPMF